MSTDARPSVLVHPNEELLEEYSFGRVSEPQLGSMEEHLLLCPQCRSDLDNIEEYKFFMKAGLASFESERRHSELPVLLESPALRWPSIRGAFSLGLCLRKMSVNTNFLTTAAFAVLAGITLVWWMHPAQSTRPAATVKLFALRGGEGDVPRAPAGSPLNLVFNRSDLIADLAYRAEIVDGSGRQTWTGNVQMADQSLSIRVDAPLGAGVYWVRLYTSGGKLLREFGLLVE